MKYLLAAAAFTAGIFYLFPRNPGPVLLFAAAAAAAMVVGHAVVSARAVITAWRRRITVAILSLPVLIVLAWILGVPMPWQLPAVLLTLAALLVWRRWMRNADVVTRWGDKTRRKSGVASAPDIWRFGSRWALRRKAKVLRPSAAKLTRWQRLWVPTTAYGYRVARAGFLRSIWTSNEMVTLLFGAPRMGKTGWLAGRLIDAPGAALVASTRGDLHNITAAARAKRGPVVVFNAVGLGGIPTTLPFDPLSGCDDPTCAFERATDMLPLAVGGGDSDRLYWNNRGRSAFAAMLHAAALGGATMVDVAKWVADPERHKGWMVSCLRKSPLPTFVTEIEQFVGTNDKTRTSITAAITPALGWLTSPAACAAARPGARIDVEELLASNATIYLIGAEETKSEALVGGLTGYIAREARRLAGYMPNGRLDPAFSLVLDEAGILGPPLPSWTADMGGRGLSITAAFQSYSQLLARWTSADAGVILNNAGTIMLFGGTKNDDLDIWSRLAGERDEEVATADEHGRVKSRTVRKAPVFAPAQITNLRGAAGMAPARVIVFQSGMLACPATAQMLWQRPSLRIARRIEQYQTWRTRRAQQATVHTIPVRPQTRTDGAANDGRAA